MADALISLAGVLVGGVLVLAGSRWTARRQEMRHWQTLLYEAASELMLSYTQEAAAANVLRRRAKSHLDNDDSTYVIDRQRAQNKLRSHPLGSGLSDASVSLGPAIEDLWANYEKSDDEFFTAYAELEREIDSFAEVVRGRLGLFGGKRLF